MRIIQFLGILMAFALITGSSWAGRGVTEINEGTVRNVYIDKPLTGAQGYVVADWENGEVRVEVKRIDIAAEPGKFVDEFLADDDLGLGAVADREHLLVSGCHWILLADDRI